MNLGSGFYAATRDARRVLVIDPGMLGDTLHLLPALREVRRNYPQAEIHVVCSPVGAEVHQMPGVAHRLWVLPQARAQRRLAEQLRLLLALRRLRFDVSINFGGNDRNLVYAAVIGARRRLGQKRDRWHFWSGWCVPHWVTVQDRNQPAFEQRREVLTAAGFPLKPPTFELPIPDDARAWAAARLPGTAIHFSLNASTILKEWPLANWIDLARLLAQSGSQLRIVATGSSQPRERQRLEAFMAALDNSSVQIFSGLSIAQLAALLSRCSLHVGADSGVLHLAVAVGTPTISLFRKYPGLEGWLPRGPQHRVLTVECGCVGLRRPPCLESQTSACLAGIKPEVVARAVVERTVPAT
jgi:ADP-heptose:LPS heptosyltransferase